jgi:hypothetical protein
MMHSEIRFIVDAPYVLRVGLTVPCLSLLPGGETDTGTGARTVAMAVLARCAFMDERCAFADRAIF